jgi:uncharacterized protein YciI
MLWAIYCSDVPNSRPIRDEHRQAHRAYLSTYLQRIFFSGPLWDDEAFDQTGTIFLIDLESRAAVEAFLAQEPYTQEGVFATITIKRMTRGKFNPELCPPSRERPDFPS